MRRIAPYVDKIIKGVSPAEIPIEQISTFEFVIDLRVAHEAGVDVPQSLLLRADGIVK
jgi:putative ABC transport system substrate-binding protein